MAAGERSRAVGRADRRKLMAEIARAHREQARAHLAALTQAIRDARASKRHAKAGAITLCRQARLAARQRASELRARAIVELREAVALERGAARERCTQALGEARALQEGWQRARAELAAERAFRRDMRRIERANKERSRAVLGAGRRRGRELAGESDDEVRGNIPPELAALFEKVKRQIRGGPRVSRTEAFLHYAEEHPSEVLRAQEDRTDELIRDLERQAKAARGRMRRGPSARELAEEVPF